MIFWDRDVECFIIHGERSEITLQDMYFFASLPLLGVIADVSLKLRRGVLMGDLCARHYYAMDYVHASYILVCDIESLETYVVAVMVLQILGSKAPHNISGDQLLMVKSVLRGTYYGWAHMYLNTVRWGLVFTLFLLLIFL